MRPSTVLVLTLSSACVTQTRDEIATPSPTSAGFGTDGSDDTGVGDLPDDPETSGVPNPGLDPDAGIGCSAVDFLFVIDNSGSMADEQQALIDSVPAFVTSIQERLPPGSGSFHIMVVDVDAWVYAGCEDGCQRAADCEAMNQGTCDCGYPCALRTLCTAGGTQGGDYVCGVSQPAECEDVMGAGIVRPRGRDSSDRACNFATGRRYMNNLEPDLHTAFECAARVGTNSSVGEKPMESMVEAIAGTGAVAECNAGFLRDDAVLVITVITDEDDNGPHAGDLEGDSKGTPHEWFEAIVAAKGGNEKAIVALGLIGDTDQPNPICQPLDPYTYEGAEPAPRIRQFVEMFGPRGKVASVCADSYQSFFMQTVETIGMACDQFIPEG
jgi:hypothetical protein